MATLNEIELYFGSSNDRRRLLMKGLKGAVALLKQGGVPKVFVDGSFVSDKEEPNDIDGCWSSEGAIPEVLDSRFWDFKDETEFRRNQESLKKEFGIDFFIAEIIEGGSGKPFPEFFQTNRDGEPKGIIEVNL